LQPAIPAMMMLYPAAIGLDCLGYLMHRIGRDGRRIADKELGMSSQSATGDMKG
jgi:uncharacterized protein